MTDRRSQGTLRWENAASLLPTGAPSEPGPQGALVPDSLRDNDQIAVIYDKGQTPPEITIHEVSGSVHTVLADGVAIAIVASANGPAPSKDDVLLVERTI